MAKQSTYKNSYATPKTQPAKSMSSTRHPAKIFGKGGNRSRPIDKLQKE